MDFDKIIESVCQLLAGESPELDISGLLYTHRCYDLARQMPNGTYYGNTCLLLRLNKAYVRDRMQACKAIFEQRDIPYAIIKGPILSVSAYGDPYLRQSGDLDVLIAPQDISAFSRQMKKAGFVQGKIKNQTIQHISREERIFHSVYSHQVVPFVKEAGKKICPYENIENSELTADQKDEDLVDLGMDSITFIRVVVALEEAFDIEIPDEKLLLTEMNTISKMTDVISDKRNLRGGKKNIS